MRGISEPNGPAAVSLLTIFLLLPGCAHGDSLRMEPALTPLPSPTGFVNGGTCERASSRDLPPGSGCATSVLGDVDADGVEDTVTVFAGLRPDGRPDSWRLMVTTATAAVEQELDAGTDFSYPRAVGLVDIDGDARSELFVKTFDLTGHGTPWQNLNVFSVHEGRVKVVSYEGEPLPIRVGGISRMGEGATCDGGNLILLRAEAKNVRNTHWSTSERRFRVHGSRARFIDRKARRLILTDYNDPALDPFYRLECGDVSYPPL